MKLVITGGIGCGKSTAARVFLASLPGYQLFDWDAAVAEMYASDALFQQFLRVQYGTTKRSEIGAIVRKDPKQLELIREHSDDHLFGQLKEALSKEKVVLDVPLWFEINEDRMRHGRKPFQADLVFCITAPLEQQFERVKRRSGFLHGDTAAVIRMQAALADKASLSDYVLLNNHDEENGSLRFEWHVQRFLSGLIDLGVLP